MTLMTLKVDTELKTAFAEKCKREGRSASVVLREFMKNYAGTSNSDDYSPEFYARIEKAMQSSHIALTDDLRKELLDV